MDKISLIEFTKIELGTGINVLDTDLTNGVKFVPGAAGKLSNNIQVLNDTLGLTLGKLVELTGQELPKRELTEDSGAIWNGNDIADVLQKLVHIVADFKHLESLILGGRELEEGETLENALDKQIQARVSHDVLRLLTDVGTIEHLPTSYKPVVEEGVGELAVVERVPKIVFEQRDFEDTSKLFDEQTSGALKNIIKFRQDREKVLANIQASEPN